MCTGFWFGWVAVEPSDTNLTVLPTSGWFIPSFLTTQLPSRFTSYNFFCFHRQCCHLSKFVRPVLYQLPFQFFLLLGYLLSTIIATITAELAFTKFSEILMHNLLPACLNRNSIAWCQISHLDIYPYSLCLSFSIFKMRILIYSVKLIWGLNSIVLVKSFESSIGRVCRSSKY